MSDNENDILIGQQLDSLKVVKSGIRQAIIDKGVPVSSSDPFSTYPNKIGQISGGESSQAKQPFNILTNGNIALEDNISLYQLTPSSNTTFTFDLSNVIIDTNVAYTFELYLIMSPSVYTLTFPNNLYWQDNEFPDMTNPGMYFLVFRTMDGGLTWFGNLQGRW